VTTSGRTIAVLNPNTSTSMTSGLRSCAEAVAAPGTRVLAVTNTTGPASIESHYDEAMALPGLLAAVQQGERDGVAGFVIACFGDPGLDAARELATGPVVGIAEAGMHAATLLGRSFSIVTTLGRTIGQAEHLVHRYGFADQCRSIYACEVPVLELDDPASDARKLVVDHDDDLPVSGRVSGASIDHLGQQVAYVPDWPSGTPVRSGGGPTERQA
jgi:allantoin racemase